MIKQLLGNPKPYAKNLLIALNAVIATDSKKPSDQELTQAIMKFLNRPEQTTKVVRTLYFFLKPTTILLFVVNCLGC